MTNDIQILEENKCIRKLEAFFVFARENTLRLHQKILFFLGIKMTRT